MGLEQLQRVAGGKITCHTRKEGKVVPPGAQDIDQWHMVKLQAGIQGIEQAQASTGEQVTTRGIKMLRMEGQGGLDIKLVHLQGGLRWIVQPVWSV